MTAQPTIVDLFLRRVRDDGPRAALLAKRGGSFQARTWNEIATDVKRAAAVLRKLDVQPGDRVAHLSENRYEWIVADLAIQFARAIHVPIHAPLTGPQITWQVNDCGAKVLLISGPQQVAKLVPLESQLAADLRVVAYDRCDTSLSGRRVLQLEELMQAEASTGDDMLQSAAESLTTESLATILYTSGTTGEPKGVMLTQGNLATNAVATVEAFDEGSHDPPHEKLRLNLLPLSHIYARTCDFYAWLVEGSQLALAESRETVLADCAAVRPTFINAVPYFYDKVYRALCEQKRENEPGALQAIFGGRIRRCCCGGAALPVHLYDHYLAQQLPLLLGYGLSETSPVISLSTAQHHRRGASGRLLPGVQVRIADDGEILTRGPHVMTGYYKNPAATAETIQDGWLHTGDLGRLDDDGFLFITGRKKEILVTTGGKNIAPVYLESLLTQDPLILQAIVVGDGRNCLAALIVPNPDVLRSEIISRQIPVTSRDEALIHPQVLALYADRIAERLSAVSSFEQVRHFKLLSRGFTVESGELTPKLTLRRKVIEANFAPEIAAMYG